MNFLKSFHKGPRKNVHLKSNDLKKTFFLFACAKIQEFANLFLLAFKPIAESFKIALQALVRTCFVRNSPYEAKPQKDCRKLAAS